MKLTVRTVLTLVLAAAMALPAAAQARPSGARDLGYPPRCPTTIDDVTSAPPDPGQPGPFEVAVKDYDRPDEVITAGNFNSPVEVLGRVHYPKPLACGPYPVVMMMHGRHATCYDPNGPYANQEWPCAGVTKPIPSHQGFDYLAKVLASHGMVVVSISANAISPSQAKGQYDARALLFQRHLEIWKQFATEGGPDLGTLFVGRVDLNRVGTLGHSRGGEGAMFHAALNQKNDDPVGLKAVFLIGASNHKEVLVNGIPLGVLLPYCDGDMSALPSVGYYDAARYNVPGDPAPKHTFEVMGANHAWYNTNWDPQIFEAASKDDWTYYFDSDEPVCTPGAPGSIRLSGDEQRGTAIALVSAFFQVYLQNDTNFLGILRGDVPPPRSAMTDGIHVGYHPADKPESRRDINRFTEAGSVQQSTIGGDVTPVGLSEYTLCDPADPGEVNGCLEDLSDDWSSDYGRVPHASESEMMQLRLAWNSPGATLTHEIPGPWRDVSSYRALQFRALVDFTNPLNSPGDGQDFTVELEDVTGATASTTVAEHSRSMFFPPSVSYPLVTATPAPRAIFNTVRIPLEAFQGIDMDKIRSVRFVFDRVSSGAVNVADLAFADAASG